MSFAACKPSSFKFLSINRLLAAAARSSADCAHPIIRIASEQNVLTNFSFHLTSLRLRTEMWPKIKQNLIKLVDFNRVRPRE